MNKFYDKLLLVIALLLLLAGVGFYLTSSAGSIKSDTINTQLGNSSYEAVPVPEVTTTDSTWPEAGPQSSGWEYDVFTPPKIYVENGEFTIVPIEDVIVVPPTPFGLYLSEIERVPYRIQLVGYIEEDLKDPSKTLLLFVDEESQDNVRGRVGRKRPKYEFVVKDFEITRNVEDGTVFKVAKATITDTRTNKEILLTHGETLYQDEIMVVFKSDEDASIDVELKLTKAPVNFETSLGNYILDEINLEDSSVTVTKLGSEDIEPVTETLRPREMNATSTEQPQSTPESTETESSNLNSFFQ